MILSVLLSANAVYYLATQIEQDLCMILRVARHVLCQKVRPRKV